MVRLTYFNQNVAVQRENFHLAGIEKFSFFYKYIYSATIAVVDRTGTIKTPLRMKSMFPLPAFVPIRRTFEELCNERAVEMLARAEMLGARLHVFWSGGIDSTLLLTSLLKNCTAEQKKNIVVLLTEESISEYPDFYRDHIRGKLRVDSTNTFSHILGTKDMIIGGEGNDQLFGSDIVVKLIQKFGPAVIHTPYKRDDLFTFFNEGADDPIMVNFYLDMFERLRDASPIPIISNFDFLWWINFTLKWQSVFMRVLSYTSVRNADRIGVEYVHRNYDHFFHTDAFQLWSLNNQDKKIKGTWNTYKWVCKDIIYDYTKDADYRDNKLKRGSLYSVLAQRSPFNFIDEHMHLYRELDPTMYYEPENDFK